MSGQLSYASEMTGAGYHEVKECPVSNVPFNSLIYKRDSDPIRYAIVESNGDFINWESPQEDDIAQKIISNGK